MDNMKKWNFSYPSPSNMEDRGIAESGYRLKGKRIALLITGSISAYRTPDLVRDFRREGAEVVVFATHEGLRYVSKEALAWTSLHHVIDELTPEAEHLSGSESFDAYLVAPATYNVLNKTAQGIADNVVTTTLASAIGQMERFHTPVLFAPAMHGTMHNSILTDSMKKLARMGAIIIPPKQEDGKNKLPSNDILVAVTMRAMASSLLRNKQILVTGGPTPVMLDKVRRITNKFTGALAIHIAKDAWLRGADVHLILGAGSISPPEYLEYTTILDYDEYLGTVRQTLSSQSIDAGIFSAAVADYKPDTIYSGKLPSGKKEYTLTLVPTEKVIHKVRTEFPGLYMVTFKYEEDIDHKQLMNIAQTRIDSGYNMVLANRGNEMGPNGEQIAWIVEPHASPFSVTGKQEIAHALLNRLEENL